MYRTIQRFMVRNPEVGVPTSRYGERSEMPTLPKAMSAVVFFRVRKDNQRRERVFRFVKSFADQASAASFFRSVSAEYKALLHREEMVRDEGEIALLETWRSMRRGLNEGVDPLLGSGYGPYGGRYFDWSPSWR